MGGERFLIQGLSDDDLFHQIFQECSIFVSFVPKKALNIVIQGLGLILFYDIVRYIVVQVVLQQ